MIKKLFKFTKCKEKINQEPFLSNQEKWAIEATLYLKNLAKKINELDIIDNSKVEFRVDNVNVNIRGFYVLVIYVRFGNDINVVKLINSFPIDIVDEFAYNSIGYRVIKERNIGEFFINDKLIDKPNR
jgi:hypothetical protein